MNHNNSSLSVIISITLVNINVLSNKKISGFLHIPKISIDEVYFPWLIKNNTNNLVVDVVVKERNREGKIC